MNDISTLVKGIKNIGSEGWQSLKTIAHFLNYIIHPSLIVSALWTYTQAYAFWICLMVAMFSAIFYALGFKKCFKWIPASIAIFTLIKYIGSVF